MTRDEREQELRRLIAETHRRYISAFNAEIAPWVKELCEIEAVKPPNLVLYRDRVSAQAKE